jgi:hypothetical protein
MKAGMNIPHIHLVLRLIYYGLATNVSNIPPCSVCRLVDYSDTISDENVEASKRMRSPASEFTRMVKSPPSDIRDNIRSSPVDFGNSNSAQNLHAHADVQR